MYVVCLNTYSLSLSLSLLCLTSFETPGTKLTCLRDSCSEKVPSSFVRSLLRNELLQRYERMMVLDFVEHHRDEMVWCPNCSSRIVCIEKKGTSQVVSCSSASCKSFCFKCLHADHEPAPCSIAKSWYQRKAQFLEQQENEHRIMNLQSSAWIQKHCRECPRCSVRCSHSHVSSYDND